MRTALRIVFSRYGIVVIILLLVIGVIAFSQGRDERPLGSGGTGEPAGERTTNPMSGDTWDDGVTMPACEDADCEPDSQVHDPYEEIELPEEAVAKALAFADAWIAVEGRDANTWFQGLQPYMTEETAELMRGVEPASVPATAVDGEATAEGGRVRVPMDTGTLVVTMVEGTNAWARDAWLVSVIDWEAA